MFTSPCPTFSLSPDSIGRFSFAAGCRKTDRLIFLFCRPSSARLLVCDVDKCGRGVADAAYTHDLPKSRIQGALQMLSAGMTNKLEGISHHEALGILARGVLMGKIVGKQLPRAIDKGRELVSGLWDVVDNSCEVYLCSACQAPLPAHVQFRYMNALIGGVEAVIMRCAACLGTSSQGDNNTEPGSDDYYKGLVIAAAGQHSHALFHLRQAVLMGNNPKFQWALAMILASFGQEEEANDLIEANQLQHQYPEAGMLTPLVQLQSGNSQKAAQSLSNFMEG